MDVNPLIKQLTAGDGFIVVDVGKCVTVGIVRRMNMMTPLGRVCSGHNKVLEFATGVVDSHLLDCQVQVVS